MEYERRTGEAHEIFNQQLESMMLSSTAVDPQYSSIGANVALTNLGFDRDLGLSMNDKIRYNRESLFTRDKIATDKEKAFKAQEVSDANERLRNELTGDPASDMALLEEVGRRYTGNAQVQSNIDSMFNRTGRAGDRLFEIKKRKEAEEQFDSTSAMRKEASYNQKNAALIDSRRAVQEAEANLGKTGADLYSSRSTSAGRVAVVDQELGEKLSIFYGMADDLDLDPTILGILDNMSSVVLQTDALDKYSKIDMGDHAAIITELYRRKIDPTKMTNAEAINGYIAQYKNTSTAEVSAKKEQEIRETLSAALNAFREKESIGIAKDEILNNLKEILPDGAVGMTPEQKLEFKQELLRLQSKLQIKVNAPIEKMRGDYESRLEMEKRIREAQKEIEEIANSQSLRKSRDGKLLLAQQLAKMRMNNANKTDFIEALRVLGGEDKEDLLKEYKEKWEKETGVAFEDLGESDYTVQDFLFGFVEGYMVDDAGESAYSTPE